MVEDWLQLAVTYQKKDIVLFFLKRHHILRYAILGGVFNTLHLQMWKKRSFPHSFCGNGEKL